MRLPLHVCFLTGEDLLCRSVWSERSVASGFATTVSRCRHGEEMLSCSSFSHNGARAGERVEVIIRESLFSILKKYRLNCQPDASHYLHQRASKVEECLVISFLTGERWAERVCCRQWERRARCVRRSALLYRP